jgi:hypothetical protein
MTTEEIVFVKIMSGMMTYAIGQVAQMDEDYANKLKALDEVIQYKVGDDIAYYTVIKDGKVEGFDGTADNPTLVNEIALEDMVKMFSGQADAASIVSKMKISDANKAAELAFILEKVGEYMEGMGG